MTFHVKKASIEGVSEKLVLLQRKLFMRSGKFLALMRLHWSKHKLSCTVAKDRPETVFLLRMLCSCNPAHGKHGNQYAKKAEN
jgi:hypothetical protein